MTQPLFVLGKQRSGTTWLSTQLTQHPQITGVRHDHHGGIHESAYFSHIAGRYGDLAQNMNYVEFVEIMAVSDMMTILEVDKDFLYSLYPTSYEGVFRAVMDRLAKKEHARYWLDKTPEHTLLANKLGRLFPDAKFIAITRNARDVMRSTIGRYNTQGIRRLYIIVRGTLNLAHHNKEITYFARHSHRVRLITFESMRENPESVFRNLCDFLELPFETRMLEEAYKPNTTFRPGRQRSSALSNQEERLVDLTMAISHFIPISIFRVMKYFKQLINEKHLPRWFFSMYRPSFDETKRE